MPWIVTETRVCNGCGIVGPDRSAPPCDERVIVSRKAFATLAEATQYRADVAGLEVIARKTSDLAAEALVANDYHFGELTVAEVCAEWNRFAREHGKEKTQVNKDTDGRGEGADGVRTGSVTRYRMVTAPADYMEPQVGWKYELRPCGKLGFLKIELVEFPNDDPVNVTFDVVIPAVWLGRHFEEVPDPLVLCACRGERHGASQRCSCAPGSA